MAVQIEFTFLRVRSAVIRKARIKGICAAISSWKTCAAIPLSFRSRSQPIDTTKSTKPTASNDITIGATLLKRPISARIMKPLLFGGVPVAVKPDLAAAWTYQHSLRTPNLQSGRSPHEFDCDFLQAFRGSRSKAAHCATRRRETDDREVRRGENGNCHRAATDPANVHRGHVRPSDQAQTS